MSPQPTIANYSITSIWNEGGMDEVSDGNLELD
jgi:hypothetical protein